MAFNVIDAQGRVKGFNSPSEVTKTTTGNIDNLDFANADIIRMNNASLSTIRGLAAGVAGQTVTIVSIGAGQVNLAHQDTNSAAGNRFINYVTTGVTPLAAGVGSATYQYDATTARWRLVAHSQGAYITPTFSAGNFTANGAMTYTVTQGVGDIAYVYYINGRTMTLSWYIVGTIGGTPNTQTRIAIPGGYGLSNSVTTQIIFTSDNTTPKSGITLGVSGEAYIRCYRDITLAFNWEAAGTDHSESRGTVILGLT